MVLGTGGTIENAYRVASSSLLLPRPFPSPPRFNRRPRITVGWQPSTYANLAFRTTPLGGSSRTMSRPVACRPHAIIAVSRSLCSSPSLHAVRGVRCACATPCIPVLWAPPVSRRIFEAGVEYAAFLFLPKLLPSCMRMRTHTQATEWDECSTARPTLCTTRTISSSGPCSRDTFLRLSL